MMQNGTVYFVCPFISMAMFIHHELHSCEEGFLSSMSPFPPILKQRTYTGISKQCQIKVEHNLVSLSQNAHHFHIHKSYLFLPPGFRLRRYLLASS